MAPADTSVKVREPRSIGLCESDPAPPAGSSPLWRSLHLMGMVWCVILMGQVASKMPGGMIWVALAFVGATAIVVASRPRQSVHGGGVPLALGFMSGFASYPAWVGVIWVVGVAVGLTGDSETARSLPTSPSIWLATVLLSPVFEELLYRERLLPALRARFGVVPAVVLSSVLFAVSHVYAWSVLSTFLVGLSLGAVYAVSGSVALCIAMHAGFNLATLVCGLPPDRYVLTPLWSSILSWTLLLLSIGWVRRQAGGGLRRFALQGG